jgi:pSer/pThr/pTyr-binding forkhead associated (FHA) protein
MANMDDEQFEGTIIDPGHARPRMKDSLVPPETGIFLRIEEGEEKGKVITLSPGGVYTFGRTGADIALQDPKVSRKHAELGLYGPGAYVLRDLASSNGVFVNDRRVQEKVKLDNGALIRIGDTSLRLTVLDNSVPLS